MTLQHSDPTRQPAHYCVTPCILCRAASALQKTNDRQFVEDSCAIRDMRAGQMLETDQQSAVIQAFLRCAGAPLLEEPRPHPVLTSEAEPRR